MPRELLNRLLEQSFDSLSKEEKLNFIERLFRKLPAPAQQEFLLELSRHIWSNEPRPRGFQPGGRSSEPDGPFYRRGSVPMAFCLDYMRSYETAAPTDAPSPARLFAALADGNRLKIVKLLATGEKSVDEILKTIGLSQSTVSHHLRILKEAGLVEMEKRGRNSVYALTQPLDPDPPPASESDPLQT